VGHSLGHLKIATGKYLIFSFARTDRRIIPGIKLGKMEYLISSKKKYVNEQVSFKI